MNFPYLRYATRDGGIVYRPVVPVDLAGPDGEVDFYGLVDTGSDDSLIPRFVANELGLEIDDGQITEVVGLGSERVAVASAQVELRISDGSESVSWHATVGVVGTDEEDADFVILGHNSCLDFFTAIFDGDHRLLQRAANSKLPRTSELAGES
ncbi:MAG: hypothetical protein CMJ64_12600 [Planctomycetaceae bacterium]|nr:hypothetical protein [Planctomycetaceae bacterium]